MSALSIDGLIKDLLAINRATRSGSASRLRITWKKVKDTRTLATLATRTERTQQQPRLPARRVQSILEQLANRNEAKVK